MKNYIELISKENLELIVSKSKFFKDILLAVGYRSKKPRYYRNLKIRLDRDKINYSHILSIPKRGKKFEEYLGGELCEIRLSTKKLRGKLIQLHGEKCCVCNIGATWNNKTLRLQVDHIDGNSRNNSIENLRLLCPNCHTQTDTYGNKNKKNLENLFFKSKKCLLCRKELSRYTIGYLCKEHSIKSRKGELTDEESKLLWPIYGMPRHSQPFEKFRKSFG